MNDSYNVVVVGGGAAGLAGAVALARSRRSVLVVDAGGPRNAPSAHVHNPGVWVAGNLANIQAHVINSAAAGLTAGAAINADLAAEDAAHAVGAARSTGRLARR
jgi:thioredoxin reductase